jgi:hypothetical protein
LFFFPPFSGRFVVYGRTGLFIFQMALPRVNTRVLLLFLFFFAINRRSYSSYSILKNKKYDEFSKTMQGCLIVTEGRGYPLVQTYFTIFSILYCMSTFNFSQKSTSILLYIITILKK